MTTKLDYFFASLLIVKLVFSEGISLIIDENFYIKRLVKYEGEHDIVNIIVPYNGINYNETQFKNTDFKEYSTLFFVEADLTESGKRIDQGLYILKDNEATKLLDHGRDAAAPLNEEKSAFFGANDGIYMYQDGKVEKYGTVKDSIIQIATEQSGDVLYILTENHDLYKVSDNGNKQEKITDIHKPEEFVTDYNNNIYFYSSNKEVKVRTSEGIKKIEGLPEFISSVKLIKPLVLTGDSVILIVNNCVYFIYSNGSSYAIDIQIKPKYMPTAFAPEPTLIQYYGYNKTIYEYFIPGMLNKIDTEEFKNYFNRHENDIHNLPTKP